MRDWIFVEDHCRALAAVLCGGSVGETYVVGARCEQRNLDLVRAICTELDVLAPCRDGGRHEERIELVADRPGHDFRYALDPAKIERELGWRPQVSLGEGLRRTIAWYLANQEWTRAALARVA